MIVDAAVLKAEGDDRNCTMEISLRGEGDLVSDDGGGGSNVDGGGRFDASCDGRGGRFNAVGNVGGGFRRVGNVGGGFRRTFVGSTFRRFDGVFFFFASVALVTERACRQAASCRSFMTSSCDVRCCAGGGCDGGDRAGGGSRNAG